MNDLAEKALHGLDVARREVVARPVAALGMSGFLAAAVIVVTGGRIGASPAAVPIDRWFGLLPAAAYRITDVGMGVVLFAAIGALIATWFLVLRVSRVRGCRERSLWTMAAIWATPFAIGPPVLSTDMYGYVARGMLARRGLSPYHHGPNALGAARLVDAIDPAWRSAKSTDGPLATLAEHAVVSVSGGSVITAVIVFRVIAMASLVLLGRLAADLAGPRRATALCLTILNPAVLIFVVSAGHLAGPLGVVLLAALLAAGQRRWTRAVVLAAVATGLKPIAILAVVAVIAVHASGRPGAARLRTAARDGLAALVTLAACVLVVPHGLGWVANFGAAARDHVPFAPSSWIADIVGFVVPSASFDDLAAGGRIAAGAAGLTVLAYLLVSVRLRPLERTVGFALLAGAVFSPVFYPPFLVWGVVCLAPTASGARRDWVIALSCGACVLAPVGLGTRGGQYATIGALTVIAVVLVPRLLVRQHDALITGSQLSLDG